MMTENCIDACEVILSDRAKEEICFRTDIPIDLLVARLCGVVSDQEEAVHVLADIAVKAFGEGYEMGVMPRAKKRDLPKVWEDSYSMSILSKIYPEASHIPLPVNVEELGIRDEEFRGEWANIAGETAQKCILDMFELRAKHEQEVTRLKSLVDSWEKTAEERGKNEAYYRGLLEEIGNMFGEESRRSDDGSLQESVICSKVVDLVKKFMENSFT